MPIVAARKVEAVVAAALESAFPPDLPAVLVSKATLDDERWVAAPLHRIAESAAAAAIEAPATLLIGRVAERALGLTAAAAAQRPAS